MRGITGMEFVLVMLLTAAVFVMILAVTGVLNLHASTDPYAAGPETIYDYEIKTAATRYGVSPALVKAVIWKESNFDPTTESDKGAVGLMQILYPDTANDLVDEDTAVGEHCSLKGVRITELTKSDLKEPFKNIMAGTCYLSYLLVRYNYNTEKTLAAYNAGPGAVDEYGDVPPYEETRTYVSRVSECYEEYRSQGTPTKCTIPKSALA